MTNPYTFTDNPMVSGVSVCNTDIVNDNIMSLKWMYDHITFRSIGEVVTSTIPLTDSGLHLLDGALISGTGSYSVFVAYIADLYNSGNYTAMFDTEANWQTAVTNYGVCGKYVFDSVNNTVRLPKWGNQIYTKDIASTVPVKGNGMQVGWTNGNINTGSTYYSSNVAWMAYPTSEYGNSVGASGGNTTSSMPNGSKMGITTDGTKSGMVTDLANITAPLDSYYYVVIATTAKTDIQVDIDEIATDLNGKTDVDLTNVNNSGMALASGWTMPSKTYTSLTVGANEATYTAPESGWVHWAQKHKGGTIGLAVVNTNSDGLCMSSVAPSSSTSVYANLYIPISKGETFKIYYYSTTLETDETNRLVFIYAKGSEPSST